MSPGLYRFVGRLLAPGSERSIVQRLRSQPGRALDVGCGPSSWLSLAQMQPYGVDISPDRVRAFSRASGKKCVVASAVALPFADGSFDSVWSFGLLHHLTDDDARTALREMRRVTCSGGRTVVFDGVLPSSAWRRPLAWLIRRLDRGHWMRRQDQLDGVLEASGAWTRERFTYSYTGLEGVLYTHAGR